MVERAASVLAEEAILTTRRALSAVEMKQRAAGIVSAEGARLGRAFRPRPSDIIISPAPKCGTTLLQQVVHGLRTRGDMDFDEINRVVPPIMQAHDLGLDLEASQPHPRAFKSHDSWDEVPKGARYIVSFRDPKDAMVSLYHFFEDWFFERGAVGIEEFAHDYFYERAGHHGFWRHLLSWWSRRDDPCVLLLCYEDMIRDLRSVAYEVGAFCGIELDPELVAIVERQSSLAFMKKHKHQFEERLLRLRSETVLGFPPGGDAAKVRVGKPGAHRTELPRVLSEEMSRIWAEEVTAQVGFNDYDAFRGAVRATVPAYRRIGATGFGRG